MISRSILYARFMKDSIPVRLGGIASDLARLSGLAQTNSENRRLFQNVLNETKFFTEWTASDLNLDAQEKLLELQRSLSRWSGGPFSKEQLSLVQDEAKKWSQVILSTSGLAA